MAFKLKQFISSFNGHEDISVDLSGGGSAKVLSACRTVAQLHLFVCYRNDAENKYRRSGFCNGN